MIQYFPPISNRQASRIATCMTFSIGPLKSLSSGSSMPPMMNTFFPKYRILSNVLNNARFFVCSSCFLRTKSFNSPFICMCPLFCLRKSYLAHVGGLQAGEFAHLQLTTDITPDFILFHINYI